MRNARSNARATSRCEMNRTLPRLAKRMRTGKPESPLIGVDQLHRHRRAPDARRSRGPGRCPGSHRPAAPPTPRRARARSRCTPRSRSTGSSGSRGGRARASASCQSSQRKSRCRPAAMWSHGQDLVLGAVPGDVPVGVEALGGHGVEPAVELEALAPLLERATGAPHPLDDPPDATVAAARDALGERRRGVVPPQLRARALRSSSRRSPTLRCSSCDAVLPEPLERRVRLGHEAADRGGGARLLGVLPSDLDDLARQLGDPEGVDVHLGGHAR